MYKFLNVSLCDQLWVLWEVFSSQWFSVESICVIDFNLFGHPNARTHTCTLTHTRTHDMWCTSAVCGHPAAFLSVVTLLCFTYSVCSPQGADWGSPGGSAAAVGATLDGQWRPAWPRPPPHLLTPRHWGKGNTWPRPPPHLLTPRHWGKGNTWPRPPPHLLTPRHWGKGNAWPRPPPHLLTPRHWGKGNAWPCPPLIYSHPDTGEKVTLDRVHPLIYSHPVTGEKVTLDHVHPSSTHTPSLGKR